MRRTVAINALIATTLLASGCVSISEQSFLGLSVSGGGQASGDFPPRIARAPVQIPAPLPIQLIPGSYYSAFTHIDPANWPPERTLSERVASSERPAAAAQTHRTPKAQPPPHNFLIKPVASGRLTSGHGFRISPLSAKPKRHNGIDYAAAKGTEVFAAGAGRIVRMYTSKSYGNYMSIRHANGYFTAYAHLNNFAPGLEVGMKVKRGQTIAAVGSTGRSTGNHLHFELIHKGRFVDPLSNRVERKLANSGASSDTLAQN